MCQDVVARVLRVCILCGVWRSEETRREVGRVHRDGATFYAGDEPECTMIFFFCHCIASPQWNPRHLRMKAKAKLCLSILLLLVSLLYSIAYGWSAMCKVLGAEFALDVLLFITLLWWH